MQRALPSLILILSISLGSLFIGLGRLPLTGADEPRYARIAEEMHHKNAWITPELQGRPWLEKPPLYYWITSPFYHVFKNPETAARMGPALCALLAALALFAAGTALSSPVAGVLSAAIVLSSLGFAGFGRSASTDMPFTCFLTLAFVILATALCRDIGLKVLAAYVFLGLAVLGKGPVALILAAGAVLLFWLFNEHQGMLQRWRPGYGIPITLAVSVPWFWLAFRENGYAFIATFFINHNLARFVTDIHHHTQPFYYYLPVLLALFFPWSGWLIVLAVKSPLAEFRRRHEWHQGMLFAVCWFVFPILFFSLSGSKLAGYILPSLPPLALILGIRLERHIRGGISRARLRTAVCLQGGMALAMAAASPYFFNKDYGGHWRIGLAISAAVLIPAGIAFYHGLNGRCRQAVQATVLQGVALILTVVLFAFPVLGDYHSTRSLAHQALALRQREEPLLTYRFFHHSLHYYTGYAVAAEPKDMESLHRILAQSPLSLVVTKTEGMKEILSSHDIASITLGRQGNFHLLRVFLKKQPTLYRRPKTV